MINLLLTGCFNYTEEQLNLINALGYNVYFLQHENKELPLNPMEIDAIVCNGLFLHHRIDDFTNLKFIQLTSAGLDRVPLDEIKRRDIKLFNARGVYSVPMAEWALFQVLQHYKQGWFFKQEQTSVRWTKNRQLKELAGTKIAIIGAGNVGIEVAKRFSTFGTEITGFDVHNNDTPYFDSMQFTSCLKEYISEYDIIVLTAPLLSSTYHLISPDILSKLKENAMLINIARGALIDENKIYNVLKKRSDIFLALDVFETEPLPDDSPLWKMENVAISPHNSFVSNGNAKRMFDVIYNNLKENINSQL